MQNALRAYKERQANQAGCADRDNGRGFVSTPIPDTPTVLAAPQQLPTLSDVPVGHPQAPSLASPEGLATPEAVHTHVTDIDDLTAPSPFGESFRKAAEAAAAGEAANDEPVAEPAAAAAGAAHSSPVAHNSPVSTPNPPPRQSSHTIDLDDCDVLPPPATASPEQCGHVVPGPATHHPPLRHTHHEAVC